MNTPLSMRAAWQQVAAEAEAITTEHWEDPDSASESGMHGTLCGHCEHEWPCPDFAHADSIRVTALAQINALNEAVRRLEAMIEANPCWFTEPGRSREMEPCERSHGAYCDQCAIRWDCEILQRVLLAESPRPDKAAEVHS